jgi:hypothetical protein
MARSAALRAYVPALAALAVAGTLAGSAPAAPFNLSPGQGWQPDGRVRAIAYSGNTVYVGGEFTQVLPPASVGGAPVARDHLAAFDATTGALLSWNPGTDGVVWALDVSGAAVYVGGQFATAGGQPRTDATAVDGTSGQTLAWDPEPNGIVNALRVGPDGNVYLGGSFTRVGGHVHNHLAQVTQGGVTTTWQPSVKQVTGFACPPRCPPYVTTLAFSADGSTLYFGGHFGLVNGVPRNNAAAVDRVTGATLPWNPDVFGTGAGKNPHQANKVWHIEIGPDRAYICGDYWALDGFQRHANLAAVDLTAGHLINSFNATTDGNTPSCVLRNGVLYIGGHYQHVGPNSAWVFFGNGQKATLTGPGSLVRTHLAAVDATTGAIDPWDPSTNSVLGVHDMVATATQLGVGGDFTRIGGTDQQGFAGFGLDTTPPDTTLTKAPPALTNDATATFAFHSSERASTFLCALDGGAFAPCVDPLAYVSVPDGSHTFQVAAVDQAGNVDTTPASASWTVDTTPPSAPTGLTTTLVTSSRAGLAWTASPQPDVAGYRVYRNGLPLGETQQTSFSDTTVSGPATYGYTVRAYDLAGNVSGDSAALPVQVPAAPPPLFQDGFESGNLSLWTSSSGVSVQTQTVDDGVYAARVTTAGSAAYASKQLTSPVGELYYAADFDLLGQATSATLLRFETDTGVPLVSVFVNPVGRLGFRNERTIENTVGEAVVASGWHRIVARVLVDGLSSEVEIWLDGVRLDDLARTVSLGTVPIGRIVLGSDAAGKSFDSVFDDVAAGQSWVG